VLVVAPSLLLPSFVIRQSAADLSALYAVIAATFGVLLLASRAPLRRLTVRRLAPRVFWGLIGVFSLVTYALIAKKYGIHLNHLSLTAESPSARQQFNNSVSGYASGTGSGALVAYLINWQSNVINPLLILLGAYRRRLSFALLGVIGQVVLFSITDFRATIVSVPFVLAIGW
jgi:ABC-type transport system involved in cytochrome c biogenesis permease subunit